MAREICIDLGTSNTVISEKNKGIILCEPTIVALEKATGKVLTAGVEARELLGKTPSEISVVCPVKSGVVADFDALVSMLKVFFDRIFPTGSLRPRVCVCLPWGITQVEKSTILEAIARAGGKCSYTIDSPVASAMGAGLDVAAPSGNMILDIGGGKMCASVVSFGGIITTLHFPEGGNGLDEHIINYIRKNFGVKIGKKTAESIKHSIGSACPYDSEAEISVTGRNEKSGLPQEITVTRSQVRDAISPFLEKITQLMQNVLFDTPAELSEDLRKSGIYLCGGSSQLAGLSEFIKETTNFDSTLCDSPITCTATGAQLLLDSGVAQ